MPVIAVGTPRYTVGTNHAVHGIGDVLHGVVRTYRLATQLGLPIYVNFEQHPLKALLAIEKPFRWPLSEEPVPTEALQVGPTVNVIDANHLLSLLTCGRSVYSVHEWCDVPWTSDECALVKYIMRPKGPLQIERPIKTFAVMHIRLGDSEMVHGKSNQTQLFAKLEQWFRTHMMLHTGWILVSDSQRFKQFIKQKRWPSLDISSELPRHSGFHAGHVTLRDYYTIAHGTDVYTYTVHTFGCPSKFAQTAAVVGQTILHEIKL